MVIDLKLEMLLYQFKIFIFINSFYMIIMIEFFCNVKYIYLKQYVLLFMYILVFDVEIVLGFIYFQVLVLSID